MLKVLVLHERRVLGSHTAGVLSSANGSNGPEADLVRKGGKKSFAADAYV